MKTRIVSVLMVVTMLVAGLSFPSAASAAGAGSGAGSGSSVSTASTYGAAFCHVVRRGENITIIARRYGVSVSAIVRINNLYNPSHIVVGQCLLIPSGQAPATCVKIHVVKRGQYLKLIAARYGVGWRKIANLNNLANPNRIYPGQRLKIPIPCKPPKPKPPPYYPPPQPPYPPPQPPQPYGAWTGKYWPNRYLSGSPWCSKKSNNVNFLWGQGGPGCGIGAYTWSARFTRTRYFYSGRYRFHIVVDDGVRLFLDGVKIIDKWHDSAPTHYTVDRDVWVGNHSLQIDYYQHVGGSRLQFWVEPIGGTGGGGNGGGGTGPWTCQFFDNTGLSGPVRATWNYNAIDFDWGTGSPVPGVTADYFSVRCTGDFGFEDGTYRFYTTVDDGARLWVGGTQVLDEWIVAGVRTYVHDVGVSAGTHPVKVEFFENNGRAVLKVRWEKR
jgi:LysM repeat protein